MTLDRIPPEILEYIAYLAATDDLLGPPQHLIPLLLANRKIHSTLSSVSNPHLYASIFEAKFDVCLAKKRLGEHRLTPKVLARELQRRMVLLKRIYGLSGSTDPSAHDNPQEQEQGTDEVVDEVLLTAYLMMLENQGRNHSQLRDYAQISKWLRYFWFHERGRSAAISSVRKGEWPSNTTRTALGMWLFWFFMKPDEYPGGGDAIESPISILKVQAMGAHKYPLSEIPWADYQPNSGPTSAQEITWYGQTLPFIPPPLAIPAILSYLAFTNRRRSLPLTPSDPTIPESPSRDEWSADWGRAVLMGDPSQPRSVKSCFSLGSIEGVWEGFFTYTEFTTYAGVLRGAPPQILQKGLVGKHQQTWKLREHHLLSADDDPNPVTTPLGHGDPLRSYIPNGTKLVEHQGGVKVHEPGRDVALEYTRAGAVTRSDNKVVDIIITGEGHSAWGQFSLVGRVRPCDGFISLSKDYVDGDRGKWLYRGYLAGNVYGNFVGRWRDTLTLSLFPGYEGCFAMSRRR
ncbi:hypothetical protein CC2G_002058 [Coprinopsis cinerea AmutBmut pab1-1]|nr:hypothetical protein CC2G_002058 [Coprinopsis cinerea AmutBmut pab1-1]